jgi:hypothetical protein
MFKRLSFRRIAPQRDWHWAIVLALTCFLPGCSSSPPPPEPEDLKVLIIGIDALDWERLDELIAEGECRNLKGLIDSGVSAVIDTNDISGSAVYWTSIATARPRPNMASSIL